DRLQAHGHRPRMGEVTGSVDGEDLEPIVGRVHREEMRAIGRQRERPHLAALELDERAGVRGRRRDEEEGDSQSPPGHLSAGTSCLDRLTITYSREEPAAWGGYAPRVEPRPRNAACAQRIKPC